MEALINKALGGNVRAIARIISLIENEDPAVNKIMQTIYPHTGKAMVIGITGSPGTGKSTLTDKMIERFRSRGKSVGIIAIDPSSPFSGGAILADRIRMQRHTEDAGVYIRSMGTRGSLGGLSRGTRESVLLLDACGKDVIIIETVGVGQSEVDIIKIANTVCVVLVPGMGDDIQIMKAGIMEIANVFVINKADKPGVDKVAAEIRLMLTLVKERSWLPPVHLTVAENGSGVEEFVDSIVKHHEFIKNSPEGLGFEQRRLGSEVEDILLKDLSRKTGKIWRSFKTDEVMEALVARKTTPYTVAGDVLKKVFDNLKGKKEDNIADDLP